MNKSMWTVEQSGTVLEQYWETRTARCPIDNAVLKVIPSTLISQDYRLEFQCPRCGESEWLTRAIDPKQAQFRPWTENEISSLKDGVFNGEHLECPVCGHLVNGDTSSAVGQGKAGVELRCERCGNSYPD